MPAIFRHKSTGQTFSAETYSVADGVYLQRLQIGGVSLLGGDAEIDANYATEPVNDEAREMLRQAAATAEDDKASNVEACIVECLAEELGIPSSSGIGAVTLAVRAEIKANNSMFEATSAVCDEALRRCDALRAQRDEAVALAQKLTEDARATAADSRILTCAFCGEAYPPGTPNSNHEALTAHVKVCAKHPVREAEASLETCEKANDALDAICGEALDKCEQLQERLADIAGLYEMIAVAGEHARGCARVETGSRHVACTCGRDADTEGALETLAELLGGAQ